MKVGDVFRSSWGYEQTNVDYFQVIKLIGKTMMLVQEIGQEREYDANGLSGSCKPVRDNFLDREPKRVKIQNDGNGRACFRQYSHSNAYQVDWDDRSHWSSWH